MNIIGVYQSCYLILCPCAAKDNSLFICREKILPLPPQLRSKQDVLIGGFDFLLGGEACDTMLAVTYRAGFNAI